MIWCPHRQESLCNKYPYFGHEDNEQKCWVQQHLPFQHLILHSSFYTHVGRLEWCDKQNKPCLLFLYLKLSLC
jgi:hypothetical protein